MRDELILAAIECFGKRGFDAVGTREIAAKVGTTMSSITYHFGGKEGLYLAAAEHIFDQLQDVTHASAEGFPGENATSEQRISALCGILRRVGEFMLREESAPFALFIAREQQLPTPEVLALMKAKVEPMMIGFVGQVEILSPDLSPSQARAITLYLLGMAITLRHSRATLQLLLETEEIDEPTAAMLLEQLDQAARRVMTQAPVPA